MTVGTQPQRDKWLTAFLILALLAAIVGAVSYILNWEKLTALLPRWSVYGLVSIVFLRILSVVAIWFWSRSGVVAYIVLTVVAILIMLAVGLKIGVFGIVGAAILVGLVWPKWQYMSWGVSAAPKMPHSLRELP